MAIEWNRDDYDMIGSERRPDVYEFRAAVRIGRAEICDEITGFAETTASCWGSPEKMKAWLEARTVCPICGGREVLDDSDGNEEPCPECGE